MDNVCVCLPGDYCDRCGAQHADEDFQEYVMTTLNTIITNKYCLDFMKSICYHLKLNNNVAHVPNITLICSLYHVESDRYTISAQAVPNYENEDNRRSDINTIIVEYRQLIGNSLLTTHVIAASYDECRISYNDSAYIYKFPNDTTHYNRFCATFNFKSNRIHFECLE